MTRDVAPSSVELARVDDVVELVELESMLFAEDAGVHDRYADVGWPRREGAGDFRRLLADPSCVVFVARSDGAVVGSAAGYLSESGPTRQPVTFGVLRSMYVRADARRTGIGGRLTDAFTDWARGAAAVRCASTATSTIRQPDGCMNVTASRPAASLTCCGSDGVAAGFLVRSFAPPGRP